MPGRPIVLTLTIANAASLSDAGDVGVATILGFNVPAITAAVLTFQASDDGVTFANVKDAAAAEVTIASSAGDMFVPAPAALQGAAFLKVRTGTAAAPVSQAAQRVIKVVLK